MEIREYLDNNDNIINGEVVDLSLEMNKYKDLFETLDNDKTNTNTNTDTTNSLERNPSASYAI